MAWNVQIRLGRKRGDGGRAERQPDDVGRFSEADALAEGVVKTSSESGQWLATCSVAGFESRTAKGAFRGLWESLHGAEGWSANPEVVVTTFDVVGENVEKLAEAA